MGDSHSERRLRMPQIALVGQREGTIDWNKNTDDVTEKCSDSMCVRRPPSNQVCRSDYTEIHESRVDTTKDCFFTKGWEDWGQSTCGWTSVAGRAIRSFWGVLQNLIILGFCPWNTRLISVQAFQRYYTSTEEPLTAYTWDLTYHVRNDQSYEFRHRRGISW
jgi:hypothetical protein